MKVFVTGGNGFIGKHMVKELTSRDIEVISFDLVPPHEKQNNIKYVIGTILDEFQLAKHMRGCDGVLHLAAILGVKRAETELLKCLNINIDGTLAVLRAMKMANVNHILLTSSSEVFGDVSNHQLKETSPFNPKSGYAVAKLAGENYVRGFHQEFGIDFNIVRFFNIYGSGQVAEFVVPRFIKMVQQGIAPTIYGDGQQVRSFCHISDAIRATAEIFLSQSSKNDDFNVGNDLEPITILDLAHKIITLSGNNLIPKMVPFSASDRKSSREIYYRVPDITKIKNHINYAPKVSLVEGLQEVIQNGEIQESWADPIIS